MSQAVAIKHTPGAPGRVYYPLDYIHLPDRQPEADQVVVRITAAALNHRDLFIRQALYPGFAFGVPILSDGCGVVTHTGADVSHWEGKRVILNPGIGWKDDPDGPEAANGYVILGGTKAHPVGTLAETVTIDADQLEEAPPHLGHVEAAALPLAGLTAWRVTMVKCANARPGRNILVTGIGGGVAIMALLFATAAGANVYVTSGNEEKIQKARELGAKGGVNYKDADWDSQLRKMLPEDRRYLDAIIDGAGSNIVEKGSKLLKAGGIIAIYGMTTSPKMPFLMQAVLKNIEVRGSTMGSRKDFADMVAFVAAQKIRPVVSSVVAGLENREGIDGLFEEMKEAGQFGKLCVELVKDGETSKL